MSVNFDISQFDSYREDNRREVKKAKGGLPLSLWESYSAFANCYGGVIILGVKENKDGSWYMTGLDNAAKLRKDLWDTINNKNKVSINLLTDDDVEIFEENSGVIMVIHVPKAKREQKPVYINGGYVQRHLPQKLGGRLSLRPQRGACDAPGSAGRNCRYENFTGYAS